MLGWVKPSLLGPAHLFIGPEIRICAQPENRKQSRDPSQYGLGPGRAVAGSTLNTLNDSGSDG